MTIPTKHEASAVFLCLVTREQSCCNETQLQLSPVTSQGWEENAAQRVQQLSCLSQLKSEKLVTYWFHFRQQYEILSLLIQSTNWNVSLIPFKQKQEKKELLISQY